MLTDKNANRCVLSNSCRALPHRTTNAIAAAAAQCIAQAPVLHRVSVYCSIVTFVAMLGELGA